MILIVLTICLLLTPDTVDAYKKKKKKKVVKVKVKKVVYKPKKKPKKKEYYMVEMGHGGYGGWASNNLPQYIKYDSLPKSLM
jgi:hypothetical protein